MNQENRTRDTFAQHGVLLAPAGDSQFIGDCPFCPPGKGEKKFYVNRLSGLFDCKTCGRQGNTRKFLEEKAAVNALLFHGPVAVALAKGRGLSVVALRAWRVGWDGLQYTIPADAAGRLLDLRRYTPGGKCLSSTGGQATLSGITDPGSDIVYLAEGEWDGIAAYEMKTDAGEPGSVYSAPGAASLPQNAVQLFNGKRVRCLYDADEAGRRGTARVHKALAGVAREVLYVHWPEGLPDGYDVRDLYNQKGPAAWKELQGLLKPECPGAAALGGGAQGPSAEEEIAGLTGDGLRAEEVLRQFRRYLYLPAPEVLDVLFGTVFANRLDGDPIWLFLVAAPGGTKTELIMSLAEAPLIRTLSTLTPRTLVSGAGSANGPDPSLLPQLDKRVLCLKDFTTILSMPTQNRDEVFGTLREVYDGRFEKAWGTGTSRAYHCRFGIIAGVTPIVEKFGASSSVLGERFIKYRIPRTVRLASDDSLIDAALANLNRETEMRSALQQTAQAALNRRIGPEDAPAFTPVWRVRFRKLAQWTAALRGVVSRDRFTGQVEYKPTAEVGTRLAKQFAKLAQGIALYRHKPAIDAETYQTILAVARSTVPDKVEEIVRHLYLKGREEGARGADNPGTAPGFTSLDLARWARMDAVTIGAVLGDLELLRVVQRAKGGAGRPLFTLSKAMKSLMDDLELYKHEERWQDARQQARRTSPDAGPQSAIAAIRPAPPRRAPTRREAVGAYAPGAGTAGAAV